MKACEGNASNNISNSFMLALFNNLYQEPLVLEIFNLIVRIWFWYNYIMTLPIM